MFPGGSGAIDLIGIGAEDSLWIFELKAGANIPAGIISELLLYVWMMQDAIRGHFMFESDRSADVDGGQPHQVSARKSIEARFVGPGFHAILDDGCIVSLLNAAMNDDVVPVNFGLLRLAGDSESAPFTLMEASAS